MKVPILDRSKNEIGKKDLPSQFDEPIRPDIIYKAVLAVQANSRQPYGAYIRAGMNVSATLSKRRRDYKTTYGRGMARTPRKVLSRSGTRFNYVGALAPNTVGGRRAHPPKADKVWSKKLNVKERRKALCSALAATMHKDVVVKRGHIVPDGFPFILSDDFEDISKTKDIIKSLYSLGFKDELDRTSSSGMKLRPGKGKNRGRPFKIKKSVLFVVSKDCPLQKSAANISGVDIVTAVHLNADLLAPGTHPGRLTLYTQGAVDAIAGMFKYN